LEINLVNNVHHGEILGIFIACYFYFTGLSAGSFIISTLSYVFGIEKFKSLNKIGLITATILLMVAPIFLIFHVGRPLRVWHLFYWFNFRSPISWGSVFLTLYPINCIICGWLIIRDNKKWLKTFGFIGILLAIMVHGYCGFILSTLKTRPLWNSPIMPLLFLVSAIVSGIAILILFSIIKDRFFSEERTVNKELVFDLSKILAWAILFDLFLVFCDLSTHLAGNKEAFDVAKLILVGKFSLSFVGIETFLGKVVPLVLILYPRTRTIPIMVIASILVMVGIFAMRYNVVIGGEFYPII
jgi:tetrathionate reductase subunit C